MKVDSIVVYRSFVNSIRKIKEPSERLAAYEAMFDYGFDHIEYETGDISGIALELIKPLLDQQFQKKMQNSANGKKGGRPKADTAISGEESDVTAENEKPKKANESEKNRKKAKKSEKKPNDNVNVNANDNANENVNGRFTPPTLSEIADYCRSRQNNVDPKRFFDYFSAGNWKDSKGNAVKNWKQKIITWENHAPAKDEEYDPSKIYDPSRNKAISDEELNDILRDMRRLS